MPQSSSRFRTPLAFLSGFVFGMIFLGIMFSSLVDSWTSSLMFFWLLGSTTTGLLAVFTQRQAPQQPAPLSVISPWLSVLSAMFLPFIVTEWIPEYIEGWLGQLIRFGIVVAIGIVGGYLRYQMDLLNASDRPVPEPEHQLDRSQALRRRRINVGFWTFFAFQLFMLLIHFGYLMRPCSWVDLPRRLIGCQVRIDLAEDDWIQDMQSAPNGRFVATLGDDGNIKFWSLADHALQQTLSVENRQAWTFVISPDSTLIAAGYSDETARLWRVRDGVLLNTWSGTSVSASVENLAFSADSRLLAGVSDENSVHVWHVADGSQLATWKSPQRIDAIRFTPDGTTLIAATTNAIDFWDAQQGRLLRSIAHRLPISTIALSPNGVHVAVGDEFGQIKILRTQDGSLLHTLKGHTEQITHLAFSPDGSHLASSARYGDTYIRIWRVVDGTELQKFPLREIVNGIAFVGDNQTLAIGALDDLYLWQIR